MKRPLRWTLGLIGLALPVAAQDGLFELGRQLFEDYAPAEVKAEYEFPSKEQWDAFAVRLDQALQGGSLEELAAYAPEARGALLALRTIPDYEDLGDWLELRIDEIDGAGRAVAPATEPLAAPATAPVRSGQGVPHYDLWVERVSDRPVPSRAAALLPRLRTAFTSEGVPPELIWIAEAESSFNPTARSPVGARGLFQFMPATAREMGLGTSLPDERLDPDKSARAAARYLRRLHQRFGEWPLALAAYNAGPTRVSRLLESQPTRNYASVASRLPAETRMYVPKVLALVALRAGVPPERIAAPPR